MPPDTSFTSVLDAVEKNHWPFVKSEDAVCIHAMGQAIK